MGEDGLHSKGVLGDQALAETAKVSGPSCHRVPLASRRCRPTRSEAVMSSWQAMVISGRLRCHAMYSTKRVLPHPVGPLSIIGMRTAYAAR